MRFAYRLRRSETSAPSPPAAACPRPTPTGEMRPSLRCPGPAAH